MSVFCFQKIWKVVDYMGLNIALTPRLKIIADQINKNAVLADIGTDHAHLPIYLVENGIINNAVASDIRSGPLERAKQNVEKYGFEKNISLRLASGLDGVKPDECDTISIAGMGGETIAEILNNAKWTNSKNYTLLLQPMTMISYLRKWLLQNGYEIIKETVCKEDKRRYVVITAKGGAEKQDIPLEKCVISNALLKADGAYDYISHLLEKENSVLDGLKQAKNSDKQRIDKQEIIVCTLKQGLEELK